MTAPKIATTAPGVVRTPRHLYYFNGSGPWPGVTTVTDILDKPALTKWHRTQVAEAAIANAERLLADRESGNVEAAIAYLLAIRTEGTNGRERGTRIHAALESVLRREPLSVEDRDMPAVAGARAWLNEHSVRPLEVEAYLIHETLGYGGTCDLIAEIDGEVTLVDWKSSKSVAWPDGRVYAEMRLQLAAYANAEFSAKVGDPQRYPVPTIQKYGIAHVTDTGTKFYPADVTEADWIAFRACLYLWGWKKGRG
ncbi:MAG: PD-(D/E)XK nuclease family protein [Hyphomicrobiales bacterium]|nr:PD-(D/E)XK nuclease family protein [Hyphomicrobiales bacterium]